MKRKWMWTLVGVAALFFVIALVIFLKSNQPGPSDELQIIQKMTAETGEVNELIRVKLFFYADGWTMVPRWREIVVPQNREDIYKKFVDLLLSGDSDRLAPVPPDTKVRATYFLRPQETLVVDFSESLLASFPGGTAAELEFIYFFVDNICYNFNEVKKVKFLVGGNEVRTLAGHLDLEKSFFPDYSYLRDE